MAPEPEQVELDAGMLEFDSRVASLAYRITNKLQEQTAEELPRPSIWRVPPHLKQSEDRAYEPKLVSIGPLHHGKTELLPMEEVKLSYLGSLLSRHKKNNLRNYVKKIINCLPEARNEYSEKIQLSDDDFVEMLVVDGCFIIEFLARRLFHTNSKAALLDRVRWGFSHLNRDLLLLENQIPFLVLAKLFEETEIPFNRVEEEPYKKQEIPDPLNLIWLSIRFLGVDLPEGKYPRADEVRHLLHLEHLCFDPDRIDDQRQRCSYSQLAIIPVTKIMHLISIIFYGLLYLIFFRHMPPPIFGARKKSENHTMTPCATQLLVAGIQFKRKNFNKFGKACELKVSFRDGILEIPFLLVTDATGTKLRNLIALEQSCTQVKTHFTSYCVFMDNLINTADDVAALRSSGVLDSMLSSDAEVADLFNGLCKEVHLDCERHYNVKLFKGVRDYCELVHRAWRAKLVHTCFRNPWAFYSVMGGLLLLALTGTQTFYTVFPKKKD